jgi:hypothetical protein
MSATAFGTIRDAGTHGEQKPNRQEQNHARFSSRPSDQDVPLATLETPEELWMSGRLKWAFSEGGL